MSLVSHVGFQLGVFIFFGIFGSYGCSIFVSLANLQAVCCSASADLHQQCTRIPLSPHPSYICHLWGVCVYNSHSDMCKVTSH